MQREVTAEPYGQQMTLLADTARERAYVARLRTWSVEELVEREAELEIELNHVRAALEGRRG